MDYQFNYGEGRHSQTGAFCKNLEEYLSSLVTGVWMENMSRDFRWRKICLRLKKGMEFKREPSARRCLWTCRRAESSRVIVVFLMLNLFFSR
jgi:hypothetical protein